MRYSSPRRYVPVRPPIGGRISPSTTIPHCAACVCDGTSMSLRASTKMADAVGPRRSRTSAPVKATSALGSFAMMSGNCVMDRHPRGALEGLGLAGCGGLDAVLDERPALELLDRDLELPARVHHDGAPPRDGLAERLPGDEADPGG